MRELLKEYIEIILAESGEGGAKYELQVFNSIKAAGASGIMKSTAGFDANLPDADITINGKVYNVEVKMNGNAQMGGGSVGWENGEFFAAGKDIEAMTPIAESLNGADNVEEINNAIKKLCSFLSRKSGKKITGFPMGGFLKSAWYEARDMGLLIPINVKLESDVGFIAKHYEHKGTQYIQIGGQGLFHLGKNPAKIPVPKLSGEVVLEVRAGKGGSGGKDTAGAGLRVQPRLKISGSSPYTLDDPKSIKLLLSSIKKQK
jgi:hypothetical protein